MVLAGVVLSVSSCKKDEDQPEIPQPVVNEPEQITTVEIHFTKEGDGSHFHVKWSDADGPGGNDPTIETINLDTNAVYDVYLTFLDESGDETEDVTAEIREEDDEHIICYEAHEAELENSLSIMRTDSDGTYEVGIESEWVTMGAATGELHLKLKHQTDGTKDGSCDPGATDIEVEFPVTIQ